MQKILKTLDSRNILSKISTIALRPGFPRGSRAVRCSVYLRSTTRIFQRRERHKDEKDPVDRLQIVTMCLPSFVVVTRTVNICNPEACAVDANRHVQCAGIFLHRPRTDGRRISTHLTFRSYHRTGDISEYVGSYRADEPRESPRRSDGDVGHTVSQHQGVNPQQLAACVVLQLRKIQTPKRIDGDAQGCKGERRLFPFLRADACHGNPQHHMTLSTFQFVFAELDSATRHRINERPRAQRPRHQNRVSVRHQRQRRGKRRLRLFHARLKNHGSPPKKV